MIEVYLLVPGLVAIYREEISAFNSENGLIGNWNREWLFILLSHYFPALVLFLFFPMRKFTTHGSKWRSLGTLNIFKVLKFHLGCLPFVLGVCEGTNTGMIMKLEFWRCGILHLKPLGLSYGLGDGVLSSENLRLLRSIFILQLRLVILSAFLHRMMQLAGFGCLALLLVNI